MAGGMASGALRPGGNLLFINEQITNSGAIGVALSGAFEAEVIVSQGCRPIWRPFTISDSKDNVIFNLEGRSPLAWIEDLIPELSLDDRALLQHGLFVGRAMDPQQESLGKGDFIIRGVTGVDRQTGTIALGDIVRPGSTFNFTCGTPLPPKRTWR